MAASIATAQVTINRTSATLLVAVRAARTLLTIQKGVGDGQVFIGPTGVTATTGYKIVTGELSLQAFTGELWGINDAGTSNTVGILELF